MKKDWTKRKVDLEIKSGEKKGWWCVKIGGKKFIMREVNRFYGEGEAEQKGAPF